MWGVRWQMKIGPPHMGDLHVNSWYVYMKFNEILIMLSEQTPDFRSNIEFTSYIFSMLIINFILL